MCCYAFELIFKVLVRACGKQPPGEHKPGRFYHDLIDDERRDEVSRIVTEHGWENTRDFLAFVDEHLCDKDRKYWMRPLPPRVRDAPVTFHIEGPRGIGALKKLHGQLSDLAIKTIEKNRDVYEDWPVRDDR